MTNSRLDNVDTVKAVYKKHPREPENVPLMSSCHLIQVKIIYTIHQ